MPNKFGRAVPVADFTPQPVLPDGLPGVPRPSGAPFEEAAAAASQVAAGVGKIADQAAAVEGRHAGAIAGQDPAYRPTGGASIRARNFDAAATATYLHNLDASVMTQMQGLYEKYKGDPARLDQELQDLHTRMSANDVFPEVAGAFNEGFAKQASAYRKAAQTHADAVARDNLLASSITALSHIQTVTRQQTAALDPNAPETEAAVTDGVKRTEAIYTDLARNGAISKTSAEKSRLDVRNGAYGDLIMRRAEALKSPQEIADFRKSFESDFAKGKYNGKLDGDGFDRVQAALVGLENGAATQARANQGALTKGFEDFAKREAAGMKPSQDEWNALVTQAKDVPGGDQIVALAEAKRQLASRLSAAPVQEGDAILQALRDKARKGGGTPAEYDLIRFGEKYVNDERKGLHTDQLGTAQRKGLIANVTPIDFQGFAQSDNPAAVETLAGQFRARVAQADAVGQTFSRDPQYLRPEEKARLAEIVHAGGDRALGLAGAIVKGAGERAPAILHEISNDAPVLAQAGVILAEGGNLQAARDAFTAAHLKQEKLLDPGTRPGQAFSQDARKAFGTAFMLQPGDQSRITQAARAIAITRANRAGIDPKDETAAGTIYDRAIQEAAGAVYVGDVQFGGVTDYAYAPGHLWGHYTLKVAVPPGVRADKFSDVIQSITDADLASLEKPPETAAGKRFSAADLHDARPVAVKGGYRFALGDPASNDPKWLPAKGGGYFVLPFSALEPALRQRMPAAFLGAAPPEGT